MRSAPLQGFVCARGHASLVSADGCEQCGSTLRATRLAADATLLLVTTVRVNPTGAPFRLGVAVTRAGRARTLCVVEGPVRGNGNDAVRLEWRDGVWIARAVRVRACSRD